MTALGDFLSQKIKKAEGQTADITKILREREVDVLVSYLPVGSEMATKWYVEQALAFRHGIRELHARLYRARALLAAAIP